uniref:(northern house mosquito) hypothetical protein n=1 Tax=Culex pipiens TaxID=7175 RepID=A0A8D8DG87_CULPI
MVAPLDEVGRSRRALVTRAAIGALVTGFLGVALGTWLAATVAGTAGALWVSRLVLTAWEFADGGAEVEEDDVVWLRLSEDLSWVGRVCGWSLLDPVDVPSVLESVEALSEAGV